MPSDPKAATEAPPAKAQASSPGAEEGTMRGLLDERIATGADYVEGVARSVRVLADDLAGDAPQLAKMVRRAAVTAENLSHDIRDKSFEELIEQTQDLARSQPGLFFGAAAAAGFLLARFVKMGMSASTPSSRRRPASSAPASSSSSSPPVQQSARTFHDA